MSASIDLARRGHWIDDWEPEDETFWENVGKKIARKNLIAVHVRRTHRLLRVGAVDNRRAEPRQHRHQAQPVGTLHPHAAPEPDRIGASPSLHAGRAEIRGPGVDDSERGASLRADDSARRRSTEWLAAGADALDSNVGPARSARPRRASAAGTSRPRWRTFHSSTPSARRVSLWA